MKFGNLKFRAPAHYEFNHKSTSLLNVVSVVELFGDVVIFSFTFLHISSAVSDRLSSNARVSTNSTNYRPSKRVQRKLDKCIASLKLANSLQL